MDNKHITSNILRLFGIFLVTLGFIGSSACTAEDANTSISKQEVSFTVDTEQTTRATQSGTFEKGDAIGVFAFVRTNNTDKATLAGNYATNKKWVWNGSAFIPENEGDKIYYTGSKKLDFYTYYPYSEQNYNPKELTFSTEQNQSNQLAYQASDFLTAISNSGYNNEAVPLDFKHRLSTVQLKVKGIKTIAGVFVNNIFPKVIYNFESNSSSPTGTKHTASMLLTEKGGNYSTYVGCIPTQTIAVGTHLFTVKHTEGADIRIQADSAPLEEGKITAYNIGLTQIITINQTVGGNATGAGEYTHGDNATLVATPHTGHKFMAWYESGANVSTSQTYSFEVRKDRTLEPRYNKTKHTLTVVNGTGSGSYDYGAVVTIEASNLANKEFYQWSDGNTSKNRQVTVTGNATYTAMYKNITYTYKISANPTQLNFGYGAGTLAVTVQSTRQKLVNGVASGSPENVPYSSQATGTGFSVSGANVSASVNPTYNSRTGSVTFTINGRSEKTTVSLTQAAKPNVITYTYSLSVNPNFIDFESKGETKSFTVTSTRQKYVNGSASGTPENVAYSTATNVSGFSSTNSAVTAVENTSKTERIGTVTISQSASGKTTTISLIQYGKLIIET